MKFSKMIVAVVVLLNVLFTTAVLMVYWHTGSEPTALIAAWFGFTTGELWMLSCIKKTETKTEGALSAAQKEDDENV